jgi:hypothetical protein
MGLNNSQTNPILFRFFGSIFRIRFWCVLGFILSWLLFYKGFFFYPIFIFVFLAWFFLRMHFLNQIL